MKKLFMTVFLAMLILSACFVVVDVAQAAKHRIWVVSKDGTGDFITIQPALDAAKSGDTVKVKAGLYNEYLTISKTLQLLGENRETTIIDAGGSQLAQHVILITADKVGISGFTIQHSRSGGNAIWIEFCNYVTVANNIIAYNGDGIRLMNSHGNTIKDNLITENPYTAIGFDWTYGNTITGNTISNNYIGIGASYDASNNVFSNNIVSGNSYGFLIAMSSSKFYHNNIINNGVQASIYNNLANIWDNGYPSGGNYWSSYTGIDNYRGASQNRAKSDGIGDTSYIIDSQNVDRYPLMSPLALP